MMRLPSFSVIAGLFPLLSLLALMVIGGCALPEEALRRSAAFVTEPRLAGYPRLNGFFALKDSRVPAVRIDVADVEVLVGDQWLPLTRGAMVIDSENIGSGQIFLGAASLPSGRYDQLRFVLSTAETRDSTGEWTVLLAEPLIVEIGLPEPVSLDGDDSRSLFITWDVEASLAADSGFFPHLIATPAVRQLPLDLLYVSCPDIDTVFVVRADINRVVDSFGLSGRPTWIAIDSRGPSEHLYALAADARMVKVIDLSTYRTVDFFPAPLNDTPTFMTIDPEGRTAFLLDERSGYISRMDLATGRIGARALLGFQPQFAGYLESRNLLAVSLGLSQKVLLLDPVSLDVRGSFSTGNRPQGIAFSGNQLYVAEQGDNTVSVFDLDTSRNQARIAVGFGPERLLDSGGQIFVSHEQDGTLAVLLPGQLGVIREISGLGRPREMIFNPTYRRLYVSDQAAGGLAVIDVNSNLLLGRIPLGAGPFGLAVVE